MSFKKVFGWLRLKSLENRELRIGDLRGFLPNWYTKGHHKNGILRKFRTSKNFPLVGLFWLSKEILEAEEFKKAISPEAKELSDIRNFLEHKFLSIHSGTPDKKGSYFDNKAMHISMSEFNEKGLALLKIARQTLLQVSMAIFVEEAKKEKKEKKENIATVPMNIDKFEDEWKTNF